MSEQVEIGIDELAALTGRALAAIGLAGPELEIVRDVLLYAELRGNNQGLMKIPERTVAPDPAAEPMEVVQAKGAVRRLDGKRNVGMVVLMHAAEVAVDAAREHGVGLVGAFNIGTSTGAIGYYAEWIAGQGFVGIVMSGSPKAVAAEGGVDPVFGTNPIAIALPREGAPLVLDMATSSVAFMGLKAALARGEPIGDGLAYDAEGALTTDPAAALGGAIKAFGGPKGSGLALMVELLTGPLVGGAVLGDADEATNRGNLVLAFDPAALGAGDDFAARVAELEARLKATRAAPGTSGVRMPGDAATARAQAARQAGTITLPKPLLDQLRETAGD
jgi:LDH2 family malate/lactate/ureidoglycolate dehydrogenase